MTKSSLRRFRRSMHQGAKASADVSRAAIIENLSTCSDTYVFPPNVVLTLCVSRRQCTERHARVSATFGVQALVQSLFNRIVSQIERRETLYSIYTQTMLLLYLATQLDSLNS